MGGVEFQVTFDKFPMGAHGEISWEADGAAYAVTGNGQSLEFIADGTDLFVEQAEPEHEGKWGRVLAGGVIEGGEEEETSWLRGGLYYAGGAGRLVVFAESDVAMPM